MDEQKPIVDPRSVPRLLEMSRVKLTDVLSKESDTVRVVAEQEAQGFEVLIRESGTTQ